MYYICKRVREVCFKIWVQVFRKVEFIGVLLCFRLDILVDIDLYILFKVGMENIEEMDVKELEDMFNFMMKCFGMIEDIIVDKLIKKRK